MDFSRLFFRLYSPKGINVSLMIRGDRFDALILPYQFFNASKRHLITIKVLNTLQQIHLDVIYYINFLINSHG